jgi:inner membrane protein
MDSLTQFALGAAVSALCLGSKLGPRKAAIIGGALGTLPDLDVFLPFDDPVDAFVMHRGWTHSVIVHALAAPILGEVLFRVFGTLKNHRFLVWLSVFLCLSTHVAIDAMTVYGTRLFWPLYPEPVGVGSIFIIDPLYTLPLLIVVGWALARKSWSSRLRKGLILALLMSTTYLGLGLALQANAEKRAKVIFADAGIETKNVLAIAAPFNTVVWKVIGLEDDRYHNLYLSIFDDDQNAKIYTHQRRTDLIACLKDVASFKKLKWFSRGFYRADLRENQIVISDLRMGLTPDYVFSFSIAEQNGQSVQSIPPESRSQRPDEIGQDLEWLDERFFGRPSVRTAEPVDKGTTSESERISC